MKNQKDKVYPITQSELSDILKHLVKLPWENSNDLIAFFRTVAERPEVEMPEEKPQELSKNGKKTK